MPSKLGNYILLRTLGSGANSKVKLAQKSTGGNDQYYAVKIMKKADTEEDKKLLELVETEVQTMAKLKHSNIVNLIEYNKEGILVKENG